MAMLDKETADETAELAQTELADVMERLAALEVDLGVNQAVRAPFLFWAAAPSV
jgi:hypothetical protein